MKFKIIFYLIIFNLIFPIVSLAQSFTSPTYRIQWGNFNMTGGRKTSGSYILTDSVGQNAPGQYDSDGFTVKAGFQYAHDLISPFSFSIDNLDLDLGVLVSGVASTQSNIITITTPSGHGYEIMAIQNHPLSVVGTNDSIPDTTCNNDDNCSKTTSKPWTDSDAYGFGFNAIGINSSLVDTGVGTSNYFADSTYFRPFASQSNNDSAQIIMSEDKPVKNHSAKITYRANIPSYQSSGAYQNSINFIAIPKY